MVFSSFVFLFAFLPVVLFCYYVLFRNNIYLKNTWLCLCSLGFYAWGEPLIVFLMIFSIVVNYFFGISMDSKYRKVILWASVIFNLSFLFVFKYFDFFMGIVGDIFSISVPQLNIGLPIGISFYTFQIMSYVIDVYRGDVQPQKKIMYVALYISLFPQLIAGPIVRYSTVEYEISNRKESVELFTAGIERFIIGLAKKIIISNNVGYLADKIYGMGEGELTTAFLWLAAIAYTLQIFFDFSAYSDMAIGLGKMFGFNFEENFNYPYISRSITEFWRRWHISLSTWLKDYLYIPLGGNRVSKGRHMFNLFVTWFCTGLWHGANMTFIVWGLYFFVFLVLEKNLKFTKKIGVFGHVYTMLVVIISWVIFRAESLSRAISYIMGMFSFDLASFTDGHFLWYVQNFAIVLILGGIFSMPLLPRIRQLLSRVPMLYEAVLMIVFIVTVSFMFRSSYNPFIYFNF